MNKYIMTIALALAATAAGAQSVSFDVQREAFDRHNYAQELIRNNPDMKQTTVDGSVAFAASADGNYDFTGYNAQAGGTTSTGGYVPGMVNFSFTPTFAADTVYANPALSPYSCLAGDYYYSFQPNRNVQGTWNSLDLVRYNPLTWERKDSVRSRLSNGQNGIPYIPAYDKKTGLIYALSLEPAGSGRENYNLHIYNPSTRRLQQLATLCTYDMYRAEYYSIKAVFCDGNELFVMEQVGSSYGAKLYISKVNRQTGELTRMGYFTHEYSPYSSQAIWYSEKDNTFYYDHFNLYTGTTFYKFNPYEADANGVIALEEVSRPNTGYQVAFEKVSADPRTPQVDDLKATVNDDHSQATLTFTVPAAMTDGTALATANVVLTINDTPVSVTAQPGEKASVTVDCAADINIATVRVNDSHATGVTFTGGYDAPARPGYATAVKKDDGTVKISWDAPTAGKYSDFGSLYDGSDVTYNVVRNQDNHVVAQGISELSCIDADMPEYLDFYTYNVTAVSHEKEGLPAVTDGLSCGQCLRLPYENAFDTADDLNLFTIWSDNPSSTPSVIWQWNPNYHNVYFLGWNEGNDDYLAFPAIKAETSTVYEFSFDIQGRGRTVEVTVGKEATTEAQNKVLYSFGTIENGDYQRAHVFFTPEEDGIYRVAIHDISDNRDNFVNIDNVRIEAAMSTAAPDSINNFAYQNDDNGALSGTVFFDLPETNIKGEPINSLTKYEVYVNGELQKTISDAQPGSAEAVEINTVHRFNDVKVVVYNEQGNGLPYNAKIYSGADMACQIAKVDAVWGNVSALMQQTIVSWEAPTKGINGGFIDTPNLKYNLYRYDDNGSATLVKAGLTDTTYTYQSNFRTQAYVVFGVTAVNSEGENAVKKHGITQGPALKLPLKESAFFGLHSAEWVGTHISGNANWSIEQGTIFNDHIVAADGFCFFNANPSSSPAETSLTTPILNFQNVENPAVKVWIFHEANVSPDSYFAIRACEDGSNHELVSEKVRFDGNAGWQQHVFAVPSVKGKRAMIGLNAYLPDAESRCFIDSIEVVDLTGSDIALASLSYEENKVAGEVANITVEVSNMGVAPATDYEVAIFVNDEMVLDEFPEEALASTQTKTFTYPLLLTAAMLENPVEIRAELMWDGDEDESNNESATFTIQPLAVNLPAPIDLAQTSGKLTWSAPAQQTGIVVTEDFETARSFSISGFGDWTTADLDGQLTTYFTQYYENYWPNIGNPQAWLVWDPASIGSSNIPAWQPYAGEKCLLCFESSGYDVEGHPVKAGSVNDDWIIMPEVVGGTDIDFMAKATACQSYGPSFVELLSSSTDRDPASFSSFKSFQVGTQSSDAWQSFSAKVPEDAKYVAFRCTGSGFGLMLDDVTYTRAITPEFLGYNVYRGAQLVNSSVVINPEFVATAVGTYAVSALYNIGESQLSNAVEISEIDGISEIAADAADAPMYNVAGQRINSVNQRTNSAKGIVIMNGRKFVK